MSPYSCCFEPTVTLNGIPNLYMDVRPPTLWSCAVEGRSIDAVTHLALARSQKTGRHFGHCFFVMKTLKKLFFIIRDFAIDMSRKNIGAFAGNAAFFLFLSMIPLLMCLCTFINLTPLTENDLIDGIQSVTPFAFDNFVTEIISDIYTSSAGTVTIYAIITIWSASKAMLALITGLNAVNDHVDKRNYIVLRTVAFFYTVIMLVAIFVSLYIMVFGKSLLALIQVPFPDIYEAMIFVLRFRILFAFLFLGFIFSLMYTFVPPIKLKFVRQIPGAVFSAGIWIIASELFAKYIQYFDAFSGYGSLTTIVIIMFWFYMLMYILLIGAHINRYFGPVYKFLFGWLDIHNRKKLK